MARTDFEIIRGLMVKDNALDSWIFERSNGKKRFDSRGRKCIYSRNCRAVSSDYARFIL